MIYDLPLPPILFAILFQVLECFKFESEPDCDILETWKIVLKLFLARDINKKIKENVFAYKIHYCAIHFHAMHS